MTAVISKKDGICHYDNEATDIMLIPRNTYVRIGGPLVVLLAVAIFTARVKLSPPDSLSDPIVRGSINESVYGIGTIMANKSFQIRPGIAATILRLYVKEGDSVKRGQPLVELNEGFPFTAPFDGTVTSLPVKVGENAIPQTVIVEVVDLADRYIVVNLEQRAAIRVRRGQTAKLSFENLREKSYEGRVESLYSRQTNFLVRINAPQLPPEILPGMTADVAIGIDVRENALLIPVTAIENGTVLVKNGRRIRSVPIKIGVVDGAMAEIVSGDLNEGDRLIIPKKDNP